MKMAKWILTDDCKGSVTVLKGDLPSEIDRKEVFSNSRVKFKLIYNSSFKLVGYQLLYKADRKIPRFKIYNSFGIIFNKKTEVKTKDLDLDILYEDQVLRLLSYKHPNNVRDFWLVGRWRIEAETVEEEEDA